MTTRLMDAPATTDKARALLSGVHIALAQGCRVCAEGYIRFAAQHHTVDAATLERLRAQFARRAIYTVGYQRWSVAQLAEVVARLDAHLIDIRMTPWSQREDWRKDNLRRAFGARYTHVAALGNVNYKNGGPIQLAQPEAALEPLRVALAHQPLVLLCGCHDYRTCHRAVAADFLSERLGTRVEHLEAHDG